MLVFDDGGVLEDFGLVDDLGLLESPSEPSRLALDLNCRPMISQGSPPVVLNSVKASLILVAAWNREPWSISTKVS